MSEVARWNLRVSPETDRSVRTLLAARGGARKGDLSSFVESAVREYIFNYSVEQVRKGFDGLDDEEISDLIDNAVEWARRTK